MENQGLPLCPACASPMHVTRLACPRCATEVRGAFRPALWGLLPQQQLFAERFLRARGNLKELERELGVAYQTLRGQLDEVVESLGGLTGRREDLPEQPPPLRREGVLERLRRGELRAEEALRILEAERAFDHEEGER